MQLTRLRLVLIACGTLAVFVAGFFIGGVYASTKAARSANAASLVYFAGIHDALERRQYDKAASITDTAVDGHVGVLRLLNALPWTAASFYVLPWSRTQEAWITANGLAQVRKSYETHPDKLQAQTRDFLAASH